MTLKTHKGRFTMDNTTNKNEKKKVKTWKREFSGLLVLAVFYMAFMGMLEAVALLVTPVFGFAMLAFGMDSAAKQLNLGKDTEQEGPEGYDVT